MATVGVTQAAKLTGRDPSTIFRALRTGRLSYSKDAVGNRQIDVAELQRLYPIAQTAEADARNGATQAPARARPEAPHGEIDALRLLVAAKDEALRDLRARVDAIEARLNASEGERRQLSERLQGLLMDRSHKTTAPDTPVAGEAVSAGEPPAANLQNPAAVADPLPANFFSHETSFPATAAETVEQLNQSSLAAFRPRWWRRWLR